MMIYAFCPTCYVRFTEGHYKHPQFSSRHFSTRMWTQSESLTRSPCKSVKKMTPFLPNTTISFPMSDQVVFKYATWDSLGQIGGLHFAYFAFGNPSNQNSCSQPAHGVRKSLSSHHENHHGLAHIQLVFNFETKTNLKNFGQAMFKQNQFFKTPYSPEN